MKSKHITTSSIILLTTLFTVVLYSQSAQAGSIGPGIGRFLSIVLFHPTTIGIVLAILAIMFWMLSQKQSS